MGLKSSNNRVIDILAWKVLLESLSLNYSVIDAAHDLPSRVVFVFGIWYLTT